MRVECRRLVGVASARTWEGQQSDRFRGPDTSP